MRLELELTVECEDERTAMSLDQALAPDNRYFPKDMKFGMSRRGRALKFAISSPRLRPGLSTLTGLVEDVRLFGEIWSGT